ncbi:MAG: stage II sporulation protein M [Candidatus Methanomethylicaceae archaeon]|jgi:stage II sporulation protein M
MVFSTFRSVIKENRKILAISSLILVIAIVAGSITPQGEGSSVNNIFSQLYPQINQLHPYTPTMMLYILAKNSVAAATVFFLGPLLILPPVVLLLNGFVAGYVGSLAADKYSLAFAIGILAPHGVFELPALVFAASAGIRFGIGVGRKVIRTLNREKYALTPEFMASWKLFMFALMLLLIAAVIEAYVSPWVGMQLMPS